MYEELVNTLLYDAGWLEQGIAQTEHDIAEHLKKAADAIEELSKRVPPIPHGDLIDRDVAYDKIAEQEGGNYVDMDAVGKGLEATPVIIPAEDADHGE